MVRSAGWVASESNPNQKRRSYKFFTGLGGGGAPERKDDLGGRSDERGGGEERASRALGEG